MTTSAVGRSGWSKARADDGNPHRKRKEQNNGRLASRIVALVDFPEGVMTGFDTLSQTVTIPMPDQEKERATRRALPKSPFSGTVVE
jgi:hypothetical protein